MLPTYLPLQYIPLYWIYVLYSLYSMCSVHMLPTYVRNYHCNTSVANVPQWPYHTVCLLLGHIIERDHGKGRLAGVLDGRAKLVQNKPHRNALFQSVLHTGDNTYVRKYLDTHQLGLLYGWTTAYAFMYVHNLHFTNIILTRYNHSHSPEPIVNTSDTLCHCCVCLWH